MKLVSYRQNNISRYGLLQQGTIADLSTSLGGDFPDLKALIAAGLPSEQMLLSKVGERAPLDAVELLPPIPNPGTIWCAGMNTHSHFEEAKAYMGLKDKPPKPILFLRSNATLVASGQDLEKPKLEGMFDYEGEIALVIGKRGRNVAVADALEHVVGYSCFNDASARQYQQSSNQVTAGKNAWRSGGFGPCIATRDSVEESALEMICRLNGQEMQRMPVSDLIFGFAELVAFISEFTWLEPGDVVVTGSPVGIGALRKPPVLLKAGDRVEVEVSGVGTLVNGVTEQL